MSNKELLDLAAKAAGYDLKFEVLMWSDGSTYPCYEDKQSVSEAANWVPVIRWNPLADDGDALRLASRLKIDLCFDNGGVEAIWIDEDISETHALRENADGEIDGWEAKQLATRRAIVRAAAEIGKAMK